MMLNDKPRARIHALAVPVGLLDWHIVVEVAELNALRAAAANEIKTSRERVLIEDHQPMNRTSSARTQPGVG